MNVNTTMCVLPDFVDVAAAEGCEFITLVQTNAFPIRWRSMTWGGVHHALLEKKMRGWEFNELAAIQLPSFMNLEGVPQEQSVTLAWARAYLVSSMMAAMKSPGHMAPSNVPSCCVKPFESTYCGLVTLDDSATESQSKTLNAEVGIRVVPVVW